MRTRTTRETALICLAVVLATALLTIPFELAPNGQHPDTWGLLCLAGLGVAALGMVLGYRYLTASRQARLELARDARHQLLTEEYRRLAEMAITAEEHTGLKLGDLSAQVDYMREQHEALRKSAGTPG